MSVKNLLITLFVIPLLVFLATTILATFADLLGSCYYDDGTVRTCVVWGFDLSVLFDTSHVIGLFSDGRFLIGWIGLGGAAIWVHDWWVKRNA